MVVNMKRIKLTQCLYAIVDDEDFEELSKHKWYANYNYAVCGYYAGRKDYSFTPIKAILMHKQIMNTPNGMVTDHINHDTLYNCKSNLRVCTNSQNHMNTKLRKDNTSGITGVVLEKKINKWKSQIVLNQKLIYLGTYHSFFEACCARKSA